MTRHRLALPAALVLLGACAAPDGPATVTAPNLAAAGGPTNAQSIMVWLDPEGLGPFEISGEQVYDFNHATAATYYTNTWDGNPPTVTCSGSPTACSNPAPVAPGAPAPDAQKLVPVTSQNSCNFWSGTALTGGSYTQTVFVPQGSGSSSRTYKYIYTYNVTPTVASAPAGTAWDLQSSSVNYPTATLSGFVAGQSTQARTGGNWSLKASHTLSDPLSANGTRVSNLLATVTGPSGTSTYPLNVSLGSRDPVYQSNGGTFGPTSQLFEGGKVSVIHNGLWPSNGSAFDDFAGNNGQIAETAEIAAQSFQLTQTGSYSLTITGTVKGNDGSVTQGFSVTQNITVSAGSCTQP